MNLKILVPLIVLLVIQTSNEYRNWKSYRRPKFMGDMVPHRVLNTNITKVKQKIVFFHNMFRSRVKPAASNMLKMKWHRGAAKAAQRWASECKLLIHDNTTGRYINNYGPCGQNIFIATHKVPWLFAIQTWWLEKDEFDFGEPGNNLTIVGHYTQMVWAATHKVGCGISKCYHYNLNSTSRKIFYNYVCNYCPPGNIPYMVDRPYKTGKPCESCKPYCKRKLCLNSCPFSNLWSNCEELNKVHPFWLCHTHSLKGRQRFSNCKATCTCKRRIHD